ncbi:S-layer protein [Tepiditoga spiralis]|uniref:S-layer protein n=1 Tax=Tepiditoga spiralis TaxID=2108365 RepID=A0A7G1GC05_9BACT|nr:hypothetical protein [Tepiditoga spiralis]BBE31559.1 S-layer protein [Tepiditoga spiralis]
MKNKYFIFLLIIISVLGFSTDIKVGCVNSKYKTIQEALNNAKIGDTIILEKGTYRENVIITKDVNIKGEDDVLIQPKNNDKSVFKIYDSSNVNISNIKITSPGTGINIINAGVHLNNVEIYSSKDAIFGYLFNNDFSMENSKLSGKTKKSENGKEIYISNSGIHLFRNNMTTIKNNKISDYANAIIISTSMHTESKIINNSIKYCVNGVVFLGDINSNIFDNEIINIYNYAVSLNGKIYADIEDNKIDSENYNLFLNDGKTCLCSKMIFSGKIVGKNNVIIKNEDLLGKYTLPNNFYIIKNAF